MPTDEHLRLLAELVRAARGLGRLGLPASADEDLADDRRLHRLVGLLAQAAARCGCLGDRGRAAALARFRLEDAMLEVLQAVSGPGDDAATVEAAVPRALADPT
jgi:hypothetical protein